MYVHPHQVCCSAFFLPQYEHNPFRQVIDNRLWPHIVGNKGMALPMAVRAAKFPLKLHYNRLLYVSHAVAANATTCVPNRLTPWTLNPH